MKKKLFFLTTLFFPCALLSQQIALVDEIKGRYGVINGLAINESGQRFYLIESASDSLVFNENVAYILPRDPLNTSPYYFGRPYFVGFDDDQLFFVKRPGGTALSLQDTSIYVFNTIVEDTLFALDTFFVNAANGPGANLLLTEYNHAGQVLKSKHWHAPYNCGMQVNTVLKYGNSTFFCGEYAGNDGGLLLDNEFLDIGTGNGNAFLGTLGTDYEAVWLRSVSGYNYQIENKFAINSNGKILLVGTSASSFVLFCEDSLDNRAFFDWGTDFLYLVQFDTSGNCINKKTIDYYYGATIPTAISTLSDNSFIISGTYNPMYIGFDSLYLYNPDFDQAGFLVKLSDGLDAQRVFQLEGSQGPKHIRSMITDQNDQIWITGYAQVDSLQLGNELLVNTTGSSSFGFLAVLDSTFQVISATVLDGSGLKVELGQDGNFYVLTAITGGHHKLFRVEAPTGAPNVIAAIKDQLEINLYPNPLTTGHQLHYALTSHSDQLVTHLKIYDLLGRLIFSESTHQKEGVLNLNIPPQILIIEFFTNDNTRVIKKVVVK